MESDCENGSWEREHINNCKHISPNKCIETTFDYIVKTVSRTLFTLTYLPLLERDGMHVYITYTIAGEKAELKPRGERVGWSGVWWVDVRWRGREGCELCCGVW